MSNLGRLTMIATRLAAILLLVVSTIPAMAAAPVRAVASFSILADMVQRIGGERVTVTTIVGPGSDTHVYEPTPADAKAMASANIVFVNGLGFEGWLPRLVAASGYRGNPVVVSDGIAAGTIAI